MPDKERAELLARLAELERENASLRGRVESLAAGAAQGGEPEGESFRAIFDNAADPMFIHDMQGRFLEVNQAACQRLGYAREELMALSPARIDAPEFAALVPERMAELAETGRLAAETAHLTKDGRVIPVELHARVFTFRGGPAVLSVARDLSERRRAQAGRQRDEARLASLLRIHQLRASSEQELLDYALEEAISLTQSKLGYIYHYHEDRGEFVLNTWSKEVMRECAVAQPKTVYELDKTGIWGEAVRQRRAIVVNDFAAPNPLKKGCPQGHVALTKFCTVPIFVEDRIVAVAGVANKTSDYDDTDVRQLTLLLESVWNILERQRAIKGLQESEERFRVMFDQAPLAYQSLDEDGLYLDVNQAWLNTLGYRREEVIGRWFGSFLHPDFIPHFEKNFPCFKEAGRIGGVEFQMIKADGSLITASFEGVVAYDAEGRFRQTHCIFQDITQRKRVEEALRLSEEKFRQAFQISPDSININRLSDGLYLDVNEGFLAMTGYTRQEVVGKSSLDLNIWDDPADRQRLVEGLRKHGKVTNLEAKFRFKDGRARAGLMSAVVLTLDGQPCILSITRDIDTLKQAQAAVRQWADAFQYCAHGMAIGLPATSATLTCNPAFARMLGYTQEELAGKPILSLYDPADHENVRRRIAEADGQGQARYETRMLRKDGITFPVQMDLVSVRAPDGSIPYRVATMQDITERKAAEEAVRANERRLKAILEASPDPVVVYDGQGLVTFLNPAFTRVFGWQPEELHGRRVPFVPEDQTPQVREAISRLYSTGEVVTMETRRLTKGGELLHIFLSAAGVPGTDGEITGMVVNLTDVTQTKRLEAQLRQAQKMEAIGTLAGGIAHDFNNILGAIMGFAELAQELAGEGRPNLDELAQVLRSAERARNLVRQILTFSRKADADPRPLSLNRAVRQGMSILERSLPKMIAIETHLAPDLHLVSADPNQMEQVLLNLATNAADAMPEGGRLILETQNITLSEEYCGQHLEVRPGHYVLLMVSDTGCGIEPQVLEHIFDPFFTTKEIGKGTGLGLSTVYGIVKGHGGHVYCYSEPGLGAAFKIYLPVYRMEVPAPTLEEKLPEHLLKGTETLLLVDDEPALRELGGHALAAMGYQVLTAANGEEALETYRARGGEIALVVMDLGMPGMGGQRCMKEILAINPKARIVIASGYSANGLVRASLESGAAGFVAKPFRRLDLLMTVRQALDRL